MQKTMRILTTRSIASDMTEWVLQGDAPLPEVTPGAFVHIAVGGERILRRPISVMDADETTGRLTLGISPRGEGTRALCALPAGASIDLLGPMGRGFTPGDAEVYLVGGGIGVAPLILAARRFRATRAFFGFRTASSVYGIDATEALGARVTAVTDDGSLGERALITAPLERALIQHRPGMLLACGPAPMLAAVKALAERYDVPAQVSLEERMACGVGACLVCSCATAGNGYLRVCKDGPVFDAREVCL